MFFILLAVYYTIKYIEGEKLVYTIMCGISIGLAVLTKWLPAFIVFPIWILLVLNSNKFSFRRMYLHFTILVLTTFIVFLPWQFYIYHQFPKIAQWEAHFNVLHIIQALEGHKESLMYHFIRLKDYGFFVYIPLSWFMYKTFYMRLNYKRLALLIWFLIPYLFFTIVKTKMPAYTLFSAPAIFIITALFIHYLIYTKNSFKLKIIPYFLCIGLIVFPVWDNLKKIDYLKQVLVVPQWVNEFRELQPITEKHNGKVVIFNSKRPIKTMFYFDCIAYKRIPEKGKIEELKDKGYKVIIK
jgi:4-amino-4-deoxy-L-arabinose transferase